MGSPVRTCSLCFVLMRKRPYGAFNVTRDGAHLVKVICSFSRILMSPPTTASKEAPAKEQLFDVSDLYIGPDYSRLVDQLDLDYPDISPESLVESLGEAQGDPDAAWTAIADIQEASDALAFIANKASILARVDEELRSRIEELVEADKEKLSETDFLRLVLDAGNSLLSYGKGATKYTAEEAAKEVASWFDPSVAQLLQGGK